MTATTAISPLALSLGDPAGVGPELIAEAWLQRQLLEDGEELRRALADMIRDSSNDATGLVLDLLSGTTSGPSLPPERFEAWRRQRQLVNGWLAGLGWPELG